MRTRCSGAVASTSAAAKTPPLQHCRRQPTPHRRGEASAPSPHSRSLYASAIAEDKPSCPRAVAWRPAPHRRSNSRTIRQPSTSTSKNPAAASGDTGYTPPPPVNYFDSDTFLASPAPPESLTKPAYNRYRASIDIERSTVKGWEDVVPSAGDPGWEPPPVDFWTLAAYPIPWLRFKFLPRRLTFVIAEVWDKVLLPLYELIRRSWVVSVAPAIDRRVFSGGERKRNASTSDDSGASSAAASAAASAPAAAASAASSPALETALLRWHGKRTPLDDLVEWVRALREK